MRRDPLEVRKATLRSMLAKTGLGLRFNEHLEGDGPTSFAQASYVLLVPRLDRLDRFRRDLLNVLDEIGERGAGFRPLKDAWADTTTLHGKLMVTVLGGLAEFFFFKQKTAYEMPK